MQTPQNKQRGRGRGRGSARGRRGRGRGKGMNGNGNGNAVSPQKRSRSHSAELDTDLYEAQPDLKSSKTERETDVHRLEQREKQISFGKNTLGYERYIAMVPKVERTREMPVTPDKTLKVSKRRWDGVVKAWRRRIHEYDIGGTVNAVESGADSSGKKPEPVQSHAQVEDEEFEPDFEEPVFFDDDDDLAPPDEGEGEIEQAKEKEDEDEGKDQWYDSDEDELIDVEMREHALKIEAETGLSLYSSVNSRK